jgi:hypothetical protein
MSNDPFFIIIRENIAVEWYFFIILSCPMTPIFFIAVQWYLLIITRENGQIRIESKFPVDWIAFFQRWEFGGKTVESKSHLDLKFMNFNLKALKSGHFLMFKLIVWHDVLEINRPFPLWVKFWSIDMPGQQFHHSLKEHHKISNIPKFRCEML